ncbi:MAG: sigma-70 family RNA polymerase sigma factor [Planctomycetota bacterium]
MSGSPKTRESLLIRVRDPDDALAWHQFVAIYRPVIYRLARQRGLQDCDAEDLAQRVLVSVSRAIGDWQKDEKRGSFRAWLATVARNAIINSVTRGPRDSAVGGTEFLLACGAVESPSSEVAQLVRQEHARSQLRVAAAEVKRLVNETTWDAFWMTTIEGREIHEVADSLGISIGAIYGARGRVMKQLQSIAQSMNADEVFEGFDS